MCIYIFICIFKRLNTIMYFQLKYDNDLLMVGGFYFVSGAGSNMNYH